ncbi:MAG TPA: phospholipase D-like domain-containing protein DpdK [Ktedonobacteraceae bacterium]|jgi:hypothetical protein
MTCSLAALFEELRQEAAIAAQHEALQRLKHVLEQRDIAATCELIVALLAKFRRRQEQRLHRVLDLRVVAVAALAEPTLKAGVLAQLACMHGAGQPEPGQVFNVLQSLLWFTCTTGCPDCIEESHPFQELVRPARHLLLALLHADEQAVVYGPPGWPERVRHDLETLYRARLLCEQEELLACKRELLDLLLEPVDIGFQFFYPLIEWITRTGTIWTIELRVREFAYIWPYHQIAGTLLALGLLKPSPELYLLSPWVSKVPLLDNRFGQFRALVGDLDTARLHLGDILRLLAGRGTQVRILYRAPANEMTSQFLASVRDIKHIACRGVRTLHEKGLITSHFLVHGCMNFTYAGVNINDESRQILTEEAAIWQALQEARVSWEGAAADAHQLSVPQVEDDEARSVPLMQIAFALRDSTLAEEALVRYRTL